MDPRLECAAERQGGYFTRGQAIDCGYRDRELRSARLAGLITRIRHGTYVFTRTYTLLDAKARHRILALSVADKLGPHVALSHISAAAVWDFDLFGVGLETVDVTRLDGATGRREAGVAYHVGAIGENDLLEVEGRLVVRPERAVVETATLATIESGMVTASSALRLGRIAKEELESALRPVSRWKGGRRAALTVQLSDGLCESVGEVRSLHLFWREAIPRPTLQHRVVTVDGRVIARTDFAWLEHRHLGEFDGMVKYGRLNPYDTDPGRVITDEKIREDLARAERFGMSRWTWTDLSPARSHRTADAVRQGLEQSRSLYLRNRTTISLAR